MRRNDSAESPTLSRRVLLAATGLSVAGVAGCTGDETDDESAEAADETTDDGDGDARADVGGEADVSISGDVPAEVEAGEEFTAGWTVENRGDAAAAVTYGLDISVAAEDRWEPVFQEEVDLEGGDSESDSTDPVSFDQGGTIQWRFWTEWDGGEDSETLETEVIPPTRRFGDEFRAPNDLLITAANPRLTGRYEYEDYSGERAVHTAPEGQQFAFVDLTVENDAGETRETPNRLSFELVAGDRQVEPMSRTEYERDDGYDGLNDIVDGVVEEGVLPYLIPDDVDVEDVALFHSEADFELDVRWEVTWE